MRTFKTETREKYAFVVRFGDLSPVSLGKVIMVDELMGSLRMTVDRSETNLPPRIPPSKAGVEPKRQKKPIIITPQVFCYIFIKTYLGFVF